MTIGMFPHLLILAISNDYSLRCIQLIAGVLGRAGEIGQRKRLEAAKSGKVTWLPDPRMGVPFENDEVKMKEMEEAKKAQLAARPRRTQSRPRRGRTEEEEIDDL